MIASQIAQPDDAILVYFCSPFAGQGDDPIIRANDRQRNITFAEDCSRELSLIRGVAVFTPHLIYPRYLNDDDEYERTRGIEQGLAFMRRCHEVWFRLPEWRVAPSRGMKGERISAEEMGKRVVLIANADTWDAERARLARDAAALAA